MSDGHKVAALSFTVTLSLAGVVALLWLLGGGTPSAHADSPHRVAPDCTGIPVPCHTTIQEAVDAASPGDVIKVATGVYSDVHGRPAPLGYPSPPASGIITQVVYISKTVTIQGGYTTTNWTTSYPITQPTTLDAEGRGRVILIAGDPSTSSGQAISPTIEGLHTTGGNANKLGGDPWGEWGVGSGVYVITATATISHNWVFSNTWAWRGGGLYLWKSAAMLSRNTIISNTANLGGALYLYDSDATLSGNTVMSNTAYYYGGGLYLYGSDATLSGNTVMSNTADNGGGLYLDNSAATLSGNTVMSNTALTYPGNYEDGGGGLYLYDSDATLSDNTISANFAWWKGGGLYLFYSDAMLNGNTIISNTAVFGGGLYLADSDATLSGNTVMSNTAGNGGGLYLSGGDATLSGNTVGSNTAFSGGGGLYVFGAATLSGNAVMSNTAERGGGLFLLLSDTTLTNTVVADNQAGRNGSGLYIEVSSPHLLHTTVARNTGGDGSGIYVIGEELWAPGYFSTVALTNTILVSHTVGISVTGGNTVTVNSILWHGTPITVSQATTATVAVQNQRQGDPLFAADGYHLMDGSAAIDKGVGAGVTTDIDGDSRPQGSAPDLGADEFVPGSAPDGDIYLPIIMKNASP
jgi:parallel beta-helix repeat protein